MDHDFQNMALKARSQVSHVSVVSPLFFGMVTNFVAPSPVRCVHFHINTDPCHPDFESNLLSIPRCCGKPSFVVLL